MSLLAMTEILEQFANILTADHKYSLCDKGNLKQSNE